MTSNGVGATVRGWKGRHAGNARLRVLKARDNWAVAHTGDHDGQSPGARQVQRPVPRGNSLQWLQAGRPGREVRLTSSSTSPPRGCREVVRKFASVESEVLAAEAQVGESSGFDLVVDPVAGDLEPGADVVDGQQFLLAPATGPPVRGVLTVGRYR